MNTGYFYGKNYVKELMRSLATIQISSLIRNAKFDNGETPLVSSLPADAFVFEREMLDAGAELTMIEGSHKVYRKHVRKLRKLLGDKYSPEVDFYHNEFMAYIGDCGGSSLEDESSNADVAWADYCGNPTDENLSIGKGCMVAYATFNLAHWGIDHVLANPSLARCLTYDKGTNELNKVEMIKNFYRVNFPQYKIVCSVRYRASVNPMFMIGLVHKDIADLTQPIIFDKNLVSLTHDDELQAFVEAVESLSMYHEIDYKKFLSTEKPEQVKVARKANKVKGSFRRIVDAMIESGIEQNLMRESLACLGLSKMQVAGFLAYAAKVQNSSKIISQRA